MHSRLNINSFAAGSSVTPFKINILILEALNETVVRDENSLVATIIET